jgi:HSP20 family protein
MLAIRNPLFDELITPFENAFAGEPMRRWTWQIFTPTADIKETKESYQIEMDVPGLTEKEIEMTLENRHLTVRGERKTPEEEGYTHRERAYGRFERVFHLPEDADGAHVQAGVRNGVLTVSVPKLETAKAKTIEIKGE